MAIDSSLMTLTADQLAALPNDPSVPNPLPFALGTLYTFQQAGVVLPTHNHTDANVHCTVVLNGQFTVERSSAGVSTVSAGDIIDFQANDPHSFTCVTPGQILNLIKAGTSVATLRTAIAEATAALQAVSTTLSGLPALVTDAQTDLASLTAAAGG